jgi:hypothetical protein
MEFVMVCHVDCPAVRAYDETDGDTTAQAEESLTDGLIGILCPVIEVVSFGIVTMLVYQ